MMKKFSPEVYYEDNVVGSVSQFREKLRQSRPGYVPPKPTVHRTLTAALGRPVGLTMRDAAEMIEIEVAA